MRVFLEVKADETQTFFENFGSGRVGAAKSLLIQQSEALMTGPNWKTPSSTTRVIRRRPGVRLGISQP